MTNVERFRKCGNDWRYCDGRCNQCPLTKMEYSTTTSTSKNATDINVGNK